MSRAEVTGVVTARRVTSLSYVTAAVAGMTLIAYLTVWGQRYGLDLQVYRNAVQSWRTGHNPYLLTFTPRSLPFTYPPFALLALWPLTWAPFPVTQAVLWALSLAAATASVVLVRRDLGAEITPRLVCNAFAWSCAACIVLEPARSGTDYGQIEFVLMFIVVADLLTASPLRGIGIGLAAAVKLTPLAFILVLAVSRDVKSVIRAGLSFFVWTALSWLFWPSLSPVYWFHDAGKPARIGPVDSGANECWYAVLHRSPFPASGYEPGWLLLSVATLAVSTFIAWRYASAGQQSAAMIAIALASLLVSPISWTHHWIWVLLIPALLYRSGAAIPRSVRIMLWGVIALTVAAPYWWFGHGQAADVADAVLPVWTAAVLAVWSVTAFVAWRRDPAPGPVLASSGPGQELARASAVAPWLAVRLSPGWRRESARTPR